MWILCAPAHTHSDPEYDPAAASGKSCASLPAHGRMKVLAVKQGACIIGGQSHVHLGQAPPISLTRILRCTTTSRLDQAIHRHGRWSSSNCLSTGWLACSGSERCLYNPTRTCSRCSRYGSMYFRHSLRLSSKPPTAMACDRSCLHRHYVSGRRHAMT